MQKPLVIIVDGSQERAQSIGDALGSEYETRWVGAAREALEEIRASRPTAVVVDFPFPMDDRRCLSHVLHEDRATAEIPVVAYSAWDFSNTRAKARALGCEAFVGRTAGPEGVARTLQEVVTLRHESVA